MPCQPWGLCGEERAGRAPEAPARAASPQLSVALCPEPYSWPDPRGLRVFLNDGDDVGLDETPFGAGTVFGGAGRRPGRLGRFVGELTHAQRGSGRDVSTVANSGGGHPLLRGGSRETTASRRSRGHFTCGQAYGGAGDDYIVGGSLADARLAGGRGNNTYTFSDNGWPDKIPLLILPGPGFGTLDGSGAGLWRPQVDLRGCGQCVEKP